MCILTFVILIFELNGKGGVERTRLKIAPSPAVPCRQVQGHRCGGAGASLARQRAACDEGASRVSARGRGACTRRRAARRSRAVSSAGRLASTAASQRRRARARAAPSTPHPPASAPTPASTGSPASSRRRRPPHTHHAIPSRYTACDVVPQCLCAIASMHTIDVTAYMLCVNASPVRVLV
ncbi:unnamed protein product, partial [Iphiclides podalirius]